MKTGSGTRLAKEFCYWSKRKKEKGGETFGNFMGYI